MSNEIVQQDTPKPPLAMGGRGVALQTFDEAWRFANAVHKSGLAPKSLRRPESILIALQYGAELGFPPMQALSNIADINGKACLYGDGLKALIEGSPQCQWVQEKLEGEGDGMVATCSALRVGRPEPTVRSFSVSDAKKAGLWGKSGPWVTYPQRMLQMRARAWCLRDQFADLLCGLQVAEEVQDQEVGGAPMRAGSVAPGDDLDILANAMSEATEEPSTEELIASGELVDEDPGVGQLFDTAPENEGVGV